MNRIAVVAIAVVTAAVGLFVLSRWSSDRDSEAVVVHRGSDSEIAVGSRAGDAGRESTAGGRRAGRAAPGSAESRAGEHVGEDGDADQRHGSTVVSSARARHAAKSKAEGGRSTIGERGMGRASGETATDSNRGALVEFLASQEPSRQRAPGAADSGDTADGDNELALADEEELDDLGEDGLVLSLPLDGTTETEDFTEPLYEENLTPAESGDGIVFDEGSVLTFPDAGNVRNAAGTITMQIEPNWYGSDPGDNSLFQLRTPDVWENRLQLYRNGRYLRFTITGSDGREGGVGVPIDSWVPGEQHTITVTWGEALASLYIDGQLAGQGAVSELEIPPGTPLYIGSNLPGAGPSAGGTIRDVKIYGRSLAPEEIGAPTGDAGGERP